MLTKSAITFLLFFCFDSIHAKNIAVLDVVVVGKDTIIASTHDFKIIASYDGGKSWKEVHEELIKKLGKEEKGFGVLIVGEVFMSRRTRGYFTRTIVEKNGSPLSLIQRRF